uniref:Uncharacterized protein n=1 Tax=Anguilla anguilla TaxID=7936 RepID=A0A0E9WJ27_ANGAN
MASGLILGLALSLSVSKFWSNMESNKNLFSQIILPLSFLYIL